MTRDGQVFSGGIRQVGYVVPDLDAAMAEWLSVGVGPWTVMSVDHEGNTFRGQPSAATTTVGFANDGPLQIELIQVDGSGPSVWHEAAEAGRFGQHHVAYWVQDFAGTLDAAAAAGMTLVHQGDGGGVAPFAYFQTAGGTFVEISEDNELTRSIMDHVRASAETWDGGEPSIRR